MSSITVSSLVLGSLTVEVDGSDSTLALSVLGTAPASLTIELGTPGATGATGATGPGVATGGDTGQVLVKVDATNYNTTWATAYAYQVRNTVRNETGAQLNKGTVVYINGSAGNKVTVAKALATGDATSARTFAILAEDIPNNQNGLAITSGIVEDLNTSAFSAGTQLYLSPTTAGAFTSTKPSAPDHLVYVGIVERSHANQGTVLVHIQNGAELEELHNVAIASVANNDLLAYDSSSDLWKNRSVSTLGLLTSSTAASTYYLQTNPAGYISASALAPYITIAEAASTYQTQAGMSAYLTTATASSTYLTQANAASTYLTQSSAGSTYLTQSVAASTYQTQSGMSSYLTTATAASTYQPLSGMSSYLTTSAAALTYYPMSGGSLNDNSSINILSPGANANIGITAASVSLGQNTSSDFSELRYNYLDVVNSSGYTRILPTGIRFPDATTQTSAGITAATAASTYQTISGMSSYLTTSTAASTYLTQANAASTYQTQSGMSSYLTTASAASTYYLQTNPAGYITSSALSPYLTSATAASTYLAQASNLSDLANASTARTNLGLGTAAVEPASKLVPAGGTTGQVLSKVSATDWDLTWTTVSGGGGATWGSITGTLSSQTDLQNALDAKAPLASPALTGTPTSTTAAADTNTTQIATTAYVVGQASSTAPSNDSTAASAGTSLKYARADHVHLNPLPTGGTTGQVLAKVDGTNYNVQWTTAGGGGGGGVNVQTFGSSTTSGTFSGASGWQKPSGAKWVHIFLIGGGGGGGSGAKQATTSIRGGGGGGAGATFFHGVLHADYLGSTVTVVVGAGGTGANPQSNDSSPGSVGTEGGTTSFASLFKAVGGNPGNGGSATGGGVNGAGRISQVLTNISSVAGAGGSGGTGSGSPGGGINAIPFCPQGGGGGGGATANSTNSSNGGAGGTIFTLTTSAGVFADIAGGSGGVGSTSTPATNGVSNTTQGVTAATGGGGGFYRTATTGGTGGAGGWPGGGGGGGGAADNGVGLTSGRGGTGGNGYAVIITYF